jgi:hypothetical protein
MQPFAEIAVDGHVDSRALPPGCREDDGAPAGAFPLERATYRTARARVV